MTRTIKKLLLTTMTLIPSACATTQAIAQAGPCGNLNTPSVELRLDLDKFELVFRNKKAMCLDFRQSNSGTFRIRVDAANSGYTWAAGAITVEGKNQSTGAPVIIGTNSATDPNLILVDVTDASVPVTTSADYAYWIKVPGVGMLDPIVRIIRTSVASLLAEDVATDLQERGLTLEDIGLTREELESRLRTKYESQQSTEAY